MPDDITTPVPTPAVQESTNTPTDGATPPVDPSLDDAGLGDAGKRALAAEREARRAAEAQTAALRKQIEDATKTAEQRATDDLRAAQAEAAANGAKALRYEIAAETGLPLALASRLTGSTREELAADAETLKTLIPVGATPPRTPAPDPSQGPRPVDPAATEDAEFQQFAAAMKLPSPRK